MKAKLQMILAMAGFGTIGLFVKAINLPSSEIALYRAVIALASLLVFFLFTGGFRRRFAGLKPHLLKLFLSGAAMGFNWILLFEAYKYTSIALSTLCYYFAPVIVTVLSLFLFREKLTRKQWCCSAAAVAGLALIIGVSGGGSNDLLGALLGLGAAALYATVILFNKATRAVDGITRTFLQFAAAVIVLLPYCACTGGFHIQSLQGKGLWSMLLLGVVHSGVLYCLYFTALGRLRGQQAALLGYIDPLVAVLVSAVFLSEGVALPQLLGGGIILLAALLNDVELKELLRRQS